MVAIFRCRYGTPQPSQWAVRAEHAFWQKPTARNEKYPQSVGGKELMLPPDGANSILSSDVEGLC